MPQGSSRRSPDRLVLLNRARFSIVIVIDLLSFLQKGIKVSRNIQVPAGSDFLHTSHPVKATFSTLLLLLSWS